MIGKLYADRLIAGFIEMPPDTDFQRGFLYAVLLFRREACGFPDDANAATAAEFLRRQEAVGES